MGSYPVEVASILHEYLGPFVRQAGIGRSVVEILFRIDARTQYRPDVAFISHENVAGRAPGSQETTLEHHPGSCHRGDQRE